MLIGIKCNVMPNRTFYKSVQFSALITLQLSVVTIYCIGALIHHLASAACPCKTIYISFINHLSIHYTVEHSFVSWRDEKASTVVLCSTSACLSWYFHHNPGSTNIWQFIWMAEIQKHNQATNKRTRCMSNKTNGQRYVPELILDSVVGGQGGCRGNSMVWMGWFNGSLHNL